MPDLPPSCIFLQGDIFRFQQLVLEGKFRSGPSMDRPRLLVLDRNDMVGRPPGHYTGNRTTTQVHRNWNFSNATFERIQKVWGQDIDVRLIPSFRGCANKANAHFCALDFV